jgi:para-aminobenzoate synthetase/4-amino-4-deoxychorismate lyase
MNISPASRPPWYPLPRAWRACALESPGSVLLETAGGLGGDHISYLFTEPEIVLRAETAAELATLLCDLENAARERLYAAGRIDYEAGYALHGISGAKSQGTLACFGLYREPLRFDHHTGLFNGPRLPDPVGSLNTTPVLSRPVLQIDRETYAGKFAEVQRLLAAGDTYQVNLTLRIEAELCGSTLELYETLIAAQPVDFAAIVHFEDRLSLSFSPELFFRIDRSQSASGIVTRPMKGTAPRSSSPEEDARRREWLARDEKNRAEHVMIVDLLRNDLGRICESGSVRVDDLFRVEAYPTLFQMTSTVSGDLRRDSRFADVVRALFPSGSVTGAPKRRTMEIIRDLEDKTRGVYTGAIGFLAPDGGACFSVPIRTLDVRAEHVSMGVGGGIVADSTAEAEYDECLLKASFLDQAASAPKLIETLLWSEGYPLLELHMARLSASADKLWFPFDGTRIRSELGEAAERLKEDTRVRLLLSIDGSSEIACGPISGPRSDLRVRISSRRLLSTDLWQQHKTTRRLLYDREFSRARAEGFDEVLFLNERDEIVEGAISNVFVEIEGRLYTPPLSAGALPGVLRTHLLQTHPNISERTLRVEDLESAQTIYVGNAVRGLRTIGRLHFE